MLFIYGRLDRSFYCLFVSSYWLVIVNNNHCKSEICVWFRNPHSMSVIDILTTVDSIFKKYDNYKVEKHRDSNVSSDDAFARLYTSIDANIDALLQLCRETLMTQFVPQLENFSIESRK